MEKVMYGLRTSFMGDYNIIVPLPQEDIAETCGHSAGFQHAMSMLERLPGPATM